jgi:hypothetical protein
MKTHVLWSQTVLIWFLVLSSSCGIYSGDNLYSANKAVRKTKTVGSDFSSMVQECLACRDKKSSTTKTVHLPIEFNMDQENEKPTDTKETQIYFEHDTKDLDGKTVANSVFRNWGIPTEITKQKVSSMMMGQRNKKSSDAETEELQPETSSVLFESQLGQRKKSSDMAHVQQELSNDDMCLGPQLGYKGKKPSDSELTHQKPASADMWFGLQLEKRKKKSSDSKLMQQESTSAGMWFGPRLGKRGEISSDLELSQQEPASLGMWFGPRMGKRTEKSSDSELLQPEPASIGMWFGPWLGQREKKSNDNAEQVKQEPASLGMWFGPRLGKRTKNSSDSQLAQESAGAGMWFGPWLRHRAKKSYYNVEQVQHEPLSGGMWFGPRLGRREKKDSINDEHVKQEPVSGGMWFGPRLGRREKKSYDPERFQKQKQFWTLLETMDNRPPEYEFTPQLNQDAFTENDPIITNKIMTKSKSRNIPGISDAREIMYGLSGRIGLVSHVGHKKNKITRTISRVPQGVQTPLENGNDKPPEHDFTPRLGRDLYEIASLHSPKASDYHRPDTISVEIMDIY